MLFSGESPGLTNDYRSQEEKNPGRFLQPPGKEAVTIWENSLLVLRDEKRQADNVFIRNSLSCVMHHVYKQKWCVI